MKSIQFSKEQYENLLKLVYIGNWIVNANSVGLSDNRAKFEEIEKFLFSQANQFGLSHYSDSNTPEFSSQMFEESEVHEFINEYEDLSFWEELASRLAKKKLAEKHTQKQWSKFSREKRFTLLTRIEEEMQKEFHENGLDNITLNLSLTNE